MNTTSRNCSRVPMFEEGTTPCPLPSVEDVEETSNSRLLPKAVSRNIPQKTPSPQTPNILEHGDSPPSSTNHETQHIISHEYLKKDPAFNPASLAGHKPPATANVPRCPKLLHANAKQATKGIARSVLHPRRTIIQHYRGKTAKSLSKATRPYLTPQADREFLAEYDALFQAESSRTRGSSSSGQDRQATDEADSHVHNDQREDLSEVDTERSYELQRQKVELLEAHRQSLAVAWITSRYIKRVRLAPWPMTQCPDINDERYLEKHGEDGEDRFRWEKYLGELLLYFSQPFTARYVDEGATEVAYDPVSLVERLVMATEPWQAWIMNLRDLYRWENPRRTGFWYAVFAVLWYTQHVVAFLYAYIIFIVLKSRYRPTDTVSMRESLDRVLDRSAQAHRCGELVDRYGRKDWLDPLIDEASPFIQIQLGDFASILEVLRNFYYWRNPSKTAATLFFFTSCLLVTLLGSMEFCMKIVWFIVINCFFLCWPISSHYPQYRYLVSPIRWVFWDVPSHSDWAIRYLQKHEVLRRHEMCTHKYSHGGYYSKKAVEEKERFEDAVENREECSAALRGQTASEGKFTIEMDSCTKSISFAVFRHGHQGHLILSSEGLQFIGKGHSFAALSPTKKTSKLIQDVRWSYGYDCLAQLTKRKSPLASKVTGIEPGLERLELEFWDTRIDNETAEVDPAQAPATTYGEIRGIRTRIEVLDLNRAERDEVFNLIVGWSRNHWQVMSLPSNLAEKARLKKVKPRT